MEPDQPEGNTLKIQKNNKKRYRKKVVASTELLEESGVVRKITLDERLFIMPTKEAEKLRNQMIRDELYELSKY